MARGCSGLETFVQYCWRDPAWRRFRFSYACWLGYACSGTRCLFMLVFGFALSLS